MDQAVRKRCRQTCERRCLPTRLNRETEYALMLCSANELWRRKSSASNSKAIMIASIVRFALAVQLLRRPHPTIRRWKSSVWRAPSSSAVSWSGSGGHGTAYAIPTAIWRAARSVRATLQGYYCHESRNDRHPVPYGNGADLDVRDTVPPQLRDGAPDW